MGTWHTGREVKLCASFFFVVRHVTWHAVFCRSTAQSGKGRLVSPPCAVQETSLGGGGHKTTASDGMVGSAPGDAATLLHPHTSYQAQREWRREGRWGRRDKGREGERERFGRRWGGITSHCLSGVSRNSGSLSEQLAVAGSWGLGWFVHDRNDLCSSLLLKCDHMEYNMLIFYFLLIFICIVCGKVLF